VATKTNVNADTLRGEIQKKYAEVAADPTTKQFHFHTGRPLAEMLGYPGEVLDKLPDRVVESFAEVGNPFSLGAIEPGQRVLDIGCGSGFDCIIAAHFVQEGGRVVGVDMTQEMLDRANENRRLMGLDNTGFRFGLAEELPAENEWADVVISNGVINLCPDKEKVFKEAIRVLKPGGRLMLADIITRKPVPQGARDDVDLWTA
jgi:SAM-dependent methyltransferase